MTWHGASWQDHRSQLFLGDDAVKQKIITACYLIVGFINFGPIMGVWGAGRLKALYGLEITSPDLLLLLQHRAVLFGIVGGLVLLSAIKHSLRKSAAIAAFISMSAYLILAVSGGPINEALLGVAYIDTAAILILLLAIILERTKEKV
jgi:hypothetical protein